MDDRTRDAATDALERLFDLVVEEVTAAHRNSLIKQAPGFERLEVPGTRFARFDIVNLTVVEAVCLAVEREQGKLLVARYPVSVTSVHATHTQTFGSAVLGMVLGDAVKPVSAGWSGPLPTGLPTPTFLAPGAIVQFENEVATVEAPIEQDEDVIPTLRDIDSWLALLSPSEAVEPAGKRWAPHYRAAAWRKLVQLTELSITLEQRQKWLEHEVRKLTERAHALYKAKDLETTRRVAEERLSRRSELEKVANDVEEVKTAMKSIRRFTRPAKAKKW